MPTLASPLPKAMTDLGFKKPDAARRRGPLKGLMIRSEGEADTGKTEFLMSAPGPGAVLVLDRGFDAAFDNQAPPSTRREDFGFKVIKVPSQSESKDAAYFGPYWADILVNYVKALGEPSIRTVCIDGDNHGWDVQRLAEHGKLTGVYPATKFSGVYGARRSFIWRGWDTGKIIIFTNWVRDEYVEVIDPNTGLAVIDDFTGEKKKEKTGKKTQTGFPDINYCWQICIRHLYNPPVPAVMLPGGRIAKATQPARWGLVITKAKANPNVVGQELWDEMCNFTGLVSVVYPHIPLEDWGL